MARLMVLALLLLAAVAVVAVLLMVLATRRPSAPPQHASNDQWAAYYRDLAKDARRTGDTDSAATYESLARTYSGLVD